MSRGERQNTAKLIKPLTPRLLLLFFNGATGLAYQVIWARKFAAGLGHEFPSTLAIITAFMSGLGIGALLFRGWPERYRVYAYGVLELIIGIWAIGGALLIPSFNHLLREFIGPSPSWAWQMGCSFLGVLLFLLPATAAMGATLPAAADFVPSGRESRTVAALYATNTAGAMLGALGAAFLLMPTLGLSRSLFVLGTINVACGVVAVRMALPKSDEKGEKGEKSTGFVLFLLGFLGLGYEVLGIRLLSHILENTILTFASVLAVFLLGTAGGAYLYGRQKVGNKTDPSFPIAALSLCTLGLAATSPALPSFYQWLRSGFGTAPAWQMSTEAITSGVLFLLPCLLMGWLFAHYAGALAPTRHGLAKAVATNSFGAALAPLMVGTILLPWLQSKGVALLLSAGYAVLIPRKLLRFTVLPVLLLVFSISPKQFTPVQVPPGQDVKWFREGVMGSVAVLESTNGHRVLKVNNRFQMGGTAARIAEERHATIPLLLHPNPRRALFLGLGTGITFSAAQEFSGLDADGVELVPEVVQAMRYFAGELEQGVYAPPGLQVIIADARRYVQTTPRKYDVVVGDLFHPSQDGAAFLYTREHFAAIRGSLGETGIFCQWLPLYQLDLEGVRMIIQTFLEVFPNASAWLLRLNIDTPVLGLIGFKEEPSFSREWLRVRLQDLPTARHLRSVGLADEIRLFGSYVTGQEGLRRLAAGAGLNTDDHPGILFAAAGQVYRPIRQPYTSLEQILELTEADLAALFPNDSEFGRRVQVYIQARDHYLKGLMLEDQGEIQRAIVMYIESAEMSEDFTSGYAQALTIATALWSRQPEAARQILLELQRAQPNRPAAGQLLDRFSRRIDTQ